MCTFLGVIRVDFANEKTGEVIQGWQLWLAEPADAPSVGLYPTKKWLKDEQAERLFAAVGGIAGAGKYAGRQVDVTMGLRGQVSGIRFLDK